jgi:hypothetical protein
MADYYSLISRAIAALPQQTPDSRQAVYERARKALFNQLRGIQPPVAEADIAAEGRALEEAIARLELELAAKNGQGSGAQVSSGQASGGQASNSQSSIGQAPHPGPSKSDPAPGADAGKSARPVETRAADRGADERWRETLAATESEAAREPQRPAAPLPAPPKSQRPSRRILALAGVLVALIAVVGALAWYLRERPEDLAKLKPDETSQAETADSGKFDDRVEGGASKPALPSGKRTTVVPVAQKAELWVASVQEPGKVDRIYNAAVVWRLENVGGGPGEPVGSAIRGDIDVPDAKMKISLLFQKNNDSALSASHTINVTFKPAADSPLGGVKAIGPIQMRRADAQSGEKVAGIPVPITTNNFLIGLMRGDREARNIQMLRTLAVIDLPLQLNDGRAATINMEKGPAGERVFADAIDNWSR